MKTKKKFFAAGLALAFLTGTGIAAVGEPAYQVVKKYPGFEVRHYNSYLVAEIEVKGTFDSAAFQAFKPLFEFIDGNNRSKEKIDMTAPVEQQPANQKIPMTAPVTQRSGESIPMTAPVTQSKGAGTYVLGFSMPANLTMENVPEPLDPRIKVREVPARNVAVISYSGSWSHFKYGRMEKTLLTEMRKEGLTPMGAPVFARYNHPATMPWNRRNEIMFEVQPVGN